MAETAVKFWTQFIAGEKNNTAKEQAQQTKSVSNRLRVIFTLQNVFNSGLSGSYLLVF